MEFTELLLHVFISLVFIAAFALGAVLAERKIAAYIQDRVGPVETGPFGIFQTFADILKLVQKENIVPAEADRKLFLFAPLVVFISIFAGFAVIPAGLGIADKGLNVGLLYIMAIVSIDVIGLLMAGWGSNNKFAYLGALRSVSQVISYEIPAMLALLCGIMMYGTLNLQELSFAQGIHAESPVYLFGIWDVTQFGGILSWPVIRYPHLIFAFLIYFIAALAESNRAPFDLPEAESELVAGFHTEYSGFRFAALMLAEYGNMFLASLIAAVVFFGGWNTLLPNFSAMSADAVSEMSFIELIKNLQFGYLTSGMPGTTDFMLWGTFWILAKGFFGVFIMMWIRWTVPRVRVDQLMRLGWKVLTPIAFLLIAISGVWKILEVINHL